ncbi:hypothetical protein KQI84_02530 [bacterium]|nr:hypothetical protein [bacterium]
MKRLRLSLTIPALLLTTTLLARPWYLTSFETEYPESTLPASYSCGVCHYDQNGGGDRNPYGRDYEFYFDFAIIEPLDSDDDGVTNAVEIAGNTQPGSAGDPAPTTEFIVQAFLKADGAPDVNSDRAFDVADAIATQALREQARVWQSVTPVREH